MTSINNELFFGEMKKEIMGNKIKIKINSTETCPICELLKEREKPKSPLRKLNFRKKEKKYEF